MPSNTEYDDSGGDDLPKLTFWQRLKYNMLKPEDPDQPTKADEAPQSLPELETAVAKADDKERAIGLIAAPLGAIVALLISADLINHAKATHQSTSVYQTLTFVLLGMAVLMLATAWLRKRLALGIVMALFGLGIFNLRYWGFGIPFLMGGAWLLVRAWRLQQKLKAAGGGRTGYSPSNGRLPSTGGMLPRPNKRYTPPTEKRPRPAKAKPEV